MIDYQVFEKHDEKKQRIEIDSRENTSIYISDNFIFEIDILISYSVCLQSISFCQF